MEETKEIQVLKLTICLQNTSNFKFKWPIVFKITINKSDMTFCLILYFEADFLCTIFESQAQNPELRDNTKSFYPGIPKTPSPDL